MVSEYTHTNHELILLTGNDEKNLTSNNTVKTYFHISVKGNVLLTLHTPHATVHSSLVADAWLAWHSMPAHIHTHTHTHTHGMQMQMYNGNVQVNFDHLDSRYYKSKTRKLYYRKDNRMTH